MGTPASRPQGGSATTYTFDAENRLKTRGIAGGTCTYTYDGNGALLKRLKSDGTWTHYVGGVFEKRSTGAVVKHYAGFGRTIALRDVPGGTGMGTLHFLFADHLGTTVGTLNGDSGGATNMKYWPYGAMRWSSGVPTTDKLFTGQQEEPDDPALGLYNYKARFYSTTLGGSLRSIRSEWQR